MSSIEKYSLLLEMFCFTHCAKLADNVAERDWPGGLNSIGYYSAITRFGRRECSWSLFRNHQQIIYAIKRNGLSETYLLDGSIGRWELSNSHAVSPEPSQTLPLSVWWRGQGHRGEVSFIFNIRYSTFKKRISASSLSIFQPTLDQLRCETLNLSTRIPWHWQMMHIFDI